jgi:phage baseplate assembly protein W
VQTLALVQGDLVLSSGSYLTFTGGDKIHQDLNLALNEAYGSDPYHPFWGSILDRYIGAPLTGNLQQAVINEVSRILQNYISVQNDIVADDATSNQLSRYDTADVVQQVISVDAKVAYDKITVTVVLQTMANQTVTVTRQVVA